MRQLVHGVVDELLQRLAALGGLNKPQDGMQGHIRVRSYDTSLYKCAADQLLTSAKDQLLFHAHACAVVTKLHIGLVDAALALPAVGEFNAIDDPRDKARREHPGHYRFSREAAIMRPQIDPTEWRANITQIANAQGLAMNAVDAQELSAGELEGRRQILAYYEGQTAARASGGCFAMGQAAGTAAALAGSRPVQATDVPRLQQACRRMAACCGPDLWNALPGAARVAPSAGTGGMR